MNLRKLICKIRGYHKIDLDVAGRCQTCGQEGIGNKETTQIRFTVRYPKDWDD